MVVGLVWCDLGVWNYFYNCVGLSDLKEQFDIFVNTPCKK